MNEAQDDGAPARREPPSTQHVMTRHNGLVFYGLAAASFLETAIPLHAAALLQVFTGEGEFRRWIDERWWPRKYAHGREARAYIERTWPEFDWSAAYAEFYDVYRPRACLNFGSRTAAQEALVRSVAAAQASAFYRCLGTASDDPELRRTLYRIAADESEHFTAFQRLFTKCQNGQRPGLITTYRTIVACARRARDFDVQVAYAGLGGRHWYGSVPFAEIEYPEFVQRMGDVVRRHLPLGAAQRLLFRPWWQVRAMQPARPATEQRPRGAPRALRSREIALTPQAARRL
jgi:hypothetical protein